MFFYTTNTGAYEFIVTTKLCRFVHFEISTNKCCILITNSKIATCFLEYLIYESNSLMKIKLHTIRYSENEKFLVCVFMNRYTLNANNTQLRQDSHIS